MVGSFNKRETTNTITIYQCHEFVTIFENFQWLGFFEKLIGFDDDVAMELSMNLQKPK